MTYRKGSYAIYRGKEYPFDVQENDNLTLISNDSSEIENGFSVYAPGVYTLSVKKKELTGYYRISTQASFKGITFGVLKAERGKVLISSSYENWPRKFVEELGLEQVDRGIYEKWVDEKDLEKVWEEKSPIEI
jgi:hypothetical protein